jgi:hypothetical protein
MLLLLLFGCPPEDSGEPPGGPSGGETATVEIGGTLVDDQGIESFLPMEDGDPVTMVHGPQGGWHVLGSLRAVGAPEIVSIHFTVTDAVDGWLVSDNLYELMLADGDDGAAYRLSMYGFLDVHEHAQGELNTPPELLGGKELRMQMDVRDAADPEGPATTGVLRAIAALDPADLD